MKIILQIFILVCGEYSLIWELRDLSVKGHRTFQLHLRELLKIRFFNILHSNSSDQTVI